MPQLQGEMGSASRQLDRLNLIKQFQRLIARPPQVSLVGQLVYKPQSDLFAIANYELDVLLIIINERRVNKGILSDRSLSLMPRVQV